MKDIPILYSDNDILVVNKPTGLPVQGGEGISVSLLDILERQTGSKVFPVHRLDKDTAGILVVARSSKAASLYSGYISNNQLIKKYIAVCFGALSPRSGVIRQAAGRAGNEKPAETRYQLFSEATACSLVQLELGTGRMHQIRIHLASSGAPIIADDKYGNFTRNREIRLTSGIRKLQLAACSLTLPVGTKQQLFTVPLPDHMQQCLEVLSLDCPTDLS